MYLIVKAIQTQWLMHDVQVKIQATVAPTHFIKHQTLSDLYQNQKGIDQI